MADTQIDERKAVEDSKQQFPNHNHSTPAAEEARIRRIMRFNMEDVKKKYAFAEQVPQAIVDEHEVELKRFLALCAVNADRPYGMRGPVDKLWHHFILFTKNYADFCTNVVGRFIHHVPEVPGEDARGDGTVNDGYERFLSDYRVVFGDEPPEHIWPDARFGGDPCSQCNGCKSVVVARDAGVQCSGCDGCSAPEQPER